jgi:hypothetical protein
MDFDSSRTSTHRYDLGDPLAKGQIKNSDKRTDSKKKIATTKIFFRPRKKSLSVQMQTEHPVWQIKSDTEPLKPYIVEATRNILNTAEKEALFELGKIQGFHDNYNFIIKVTTCVNQVKQGDFMTRDMFRQLLGDLRQLSKCYVAIATQFAQVKTRAELSPLARIRISTFESDCQEDHEATTKLIEIWAPLLENC